ncbi:MAG: LssY C-terminal domain-containing protein [Desulfobacterales bacterium]
MTLAILFALALAGCATTRTTSPFEPKSINEVRFRDRAQSKNDPDVRVTTSVPSAEETEAIFGANLAGKEIQPIWVKVENHSDRTYYLVSAAVDPNYFSPNEASNAVGGGLGKSAQKEIEYYFRSMTFRNPILPNAAVSGFIFTNLDEGEKVVQIDLIGHQQVKYFTFFVQVPGMRVDYRMVDFDSLYEADDIKDLNEDELRTALENLPCCTTNEDGSEFGDPINLVIIGDFNDVAGAFARRGWVPAEETYSTAAWKTIKSYIFGSRYRYSPVSSLYFYGRHQDSARQKPRHDVHERNHLRLWYSPMRFEGKIVFVGQVSRDIGVRFTTKTWPPVTHKIDPDIDEARHSVVEDLLFSHTIAEFGFVKGVGRVTPSKPRSNLTGDPYFTDGLRAVIVLDPGYTSLQQIKNLGWESPTTFRFDTLGAD